jgi:nitrate reductase NapAB chaperone NapD
MHITGVIVHTDPIHIADVMKQLGEMKSVTVYGQKDESEIVAVIEGESAEMLQQESERIEQTINGVYSVFPVYVSSEE